MADGDRPKKSWKELDAQRDRSGGRSTRRDPDERSRERVEKSASYSKYKSQLDKLFTPGGTPLPESLREKLGPTTEDAKKKQALTQALRDKADAASLKEYLAAGLTLPEDGRLLVRLVDVQDAALLENVLAALLARVEQGEKPSRMLLIQKLDALKLKFGPGKLSDLAQAVRAALE